MIKFIIKLALVALVANATWRLGNAYLSFYKFKDAVTEATQFNRGSDDELRARVIELASQFGVPQEEDGFTVHHEGAHTLIDGAYTKAVGLLPGYEYPWSFVWTVDAYAMGPAREPLPQPQ